MEVKTIKIKTIGTDGIGALSFFEAERDIPFLIKRIYYISGVSKGIKRGFHAHKELKQLLFCPYGSVTIELDDGTERKDILLDDPSKGLVIEKPMWREMLWNIDNSVLLVAASDYYDESDYIRNYDDFRTYMRKTDRRDCIDEKNKTVY